MKGAVTLLIFALIVTSCKKDKCQDETFEPVIDYRDSLEGTYLYAIHHVEGNINVGNYLDTNYTVMGFVKKTGHVYDSLVEIHYGTDTLFTQYANGLYKIITENSALRVSLNIISYPGGIGGMGSTAIYGEFYGNDSLFLHVSNGGLGGWHSRDIKGYRQ